ncbi:cytochrome c1 [Phenylobacterium sp.]|uniref:cytochrome c1 n=1 Tax=Phenylobacterium sp. TaxID=1871053 RepID=UPI00271B3B9E|nr:cytochrome c1 [Phenylobacterium sp.]MDO8380917.1 cytochrome c1 [Phenylobacterium sp.]
MLRKGFILAAFGLAFVAGPALASAGPEAPKDVHWSFEGPFGKFDQAQVQRGYKVYREVCSACHAMDLMSFRNLGQKGGPFYVEGVSANDNPTVKAIAKDYQVNDIDSETGDVVQRQATSADKFPSPFANEAAARASNGGALPPDLSVMIKARAQGPQYVYSILTGYGTPPAGLEVPPNQFYNPYMPGDVSAFYKGKGHVPKGGFIAMTPPLEADKVSFDDGTKSTVDQQAKDVVAFLAWASEPKQTERKQFGVAAMIYLLVFAGLLFVSYRRIWRNVAH